VYDAVIQSLYPRVFQQAGKPYEPNFPLTITSCAEDEWFIHSARVLPLTCPGCEVQAVACLGFHLRRGRSPGVDQDGWWQSDAGQTAHQGSERMNPQ
ncbi:hypothetical protein JOB18_047649, partial [Solea senegalensis]